MVGTHVDADVVAKVQTAFTVNSETLIKAPLKGEDNQKYSRMAFLTTIKDQDYNYVRSIYATAGFRIF